MHNFLWLQFIYLSNNIRKQLSIQKLFVSKLVSRYLFFFIQCCRQSVKMKVLLYRSDQWVLFLFIYFPRAHHSRERTANWNENKITPYSKSLLNILSTYLRGCNVKSNKSLCMSEYIFSISLLLLRNILLFHALFHIFYACNFFVKANLLSDDKFMLNYWTKTSKTHITLRETVSRWKTDIFNRLPRKARFTVLLNQSASANWSTLNFLQFFSDTLGKYRFHEFLAQQKFYCTFDSRN